MRALTAQQSRFVEERAVSEQGLSLAALMRAAGAAFAQELMARVPSGDVVVLAGPGNNGGDGWVVAHELMAAGRKVRVLSIADPRQLSDLARDAAAEAITAGVPYTIPDPAPLPSDLAEAAVVVDALLGTGARLPLRDPLPAWTSAMRASGAVVASVDVPTGVDSDTGAIEDAVEADWTVTFTAPKLGLVQYPGAGCAGELVVADIGIDPEFAQTADAPEVWESERYAGLLPIPPLGTHKNARGRVLVVAGSGRYPGAAILAVRGAMRMGAGYVTLAAPDPIVPILQSHLIASPVVGLPSSRTRTLASSAAQVIRSLAVEYDAVVLGPGLTLADGAVATVRSLVPSLTMPIVLDADALNAFVDGSEILEQRVAPTVLTPHPGEMARLLGTDVSSVQADRVSSSARLSSAQRAVLLKGAGTVISGDGRRLINTSGTPALATAGTGDVLAGMVGALLAQGLAPFEAAALGAYVHGRAGEAAAASLTPICVTAEDVPDYIPAAVAELLEEW